MEQILNISFKSIRKILMYFIFAVVKTAWFLKIKKLCENDLTTIYTFTDFSCIIT